MKYFETSENILLTIVPPWNFQLGILFWRCHSSLHWNNLSVSLLRGDETQVSMTASQNHYVESKHKFPSLQSDIIYNTSQWNDLQLNKDIKSITSAVRFD